MLSGEKSLMALGKRKSKLQDTYYQKKGNKCSQGCEKIGVLLLYWWEYINKMVQPLWKTVQWLLKIF